MKIDCYRSLQAINTVKQFFSIHNSQPEAVNIDAL